MKSNTRRITFSAVAVAISAVCVLLTNVLPISFALLAIAAVCYYLVFDKCGVAFGFLAILASVGISFSMGLTSAFLLNTIIFVPYSVVAYFCRKFIYTNNKYAIIRSIIVGLYAILLFYILTLVFNWILTTGYTGSTDSVAHLDKLINNVGVIIAGVIFTLVTVIFDFAFQILVKQLSARIKT